MKNDRNYLLTSAVSLLHSGLSIDLVGHRGSGRSSFLNLLEQRLVHAEHTVLRIRGVASLKQYPLTALQLSGLSAAPAAPSAPGRSPVAITDAAESLSQAVQHKAAVILIDDWEDLDETSWGVIEAVRTEHRVPLVLVRVNTAAAKLTPSGISAGTFSAHHTVELEPLHFEELVDVLTEHLGAPVEADTAARIFTYSAGHIGIAIALVDAAVHEQRLVLQDGSARIATRSLWSPALRSLCEAQLKDITPDARTALEIVSRLEQPSMHDVQTLTGWSSIEELDAQGHLAYVPHPNGTMLTVTPPILSEFFREHASPVRQARIDTMFQPQSHTSAAAPGVHTLAQAAPNESLERTPAAQAAATSSLLLARARSAVTAAQQRWNASQSAENAAHYVTALTAYDTPESRDAIERVLSREVTDTSASVSLARYVALRAYWAASEHDDLDGAIRILHDAQLQLGEYSPLLTATEVRLRSGYGAVPDTAAEMLRVSPEQPHAVRVALLETQLFVSVVRGDARSAEQIHAQLQALEPQLESAESNLLLALAYLGEGRQCEANTLLSCGYCAALQSHNLVAYREFGAALAISYGQTGGYDGLDELLEHISATGSGVQLLPGTQLMLHTVAAMLANRRGQLHLAERYASLAEQQRGGSGPLPGQSAAWPQAQLAFLQGHSGRAADVLWHSAETLRARGLVFAALAEMLVSLEIVQSTHRLEVALQLAAEMPDLTALHAQADYLQALFARDCEAMAASIDALEAAGRLGLAIAACQHLAQWHGSEGRNTEQSAAQDRESRIRVRANWALIDSTRFNTSTSTLSEREREVAQLAAIGLSNQEIAVRLVISTRTVESHMHRVMRKLGVSNRRSLHTQLGTIQH